MSMKKRLTASRRIIKNEDGTTGVLFALLAVPIFAMVGFAVDYSRSLNAREAMQQSLDAAVLAAANAGSAAALNEVEKYNATAAAYNAAQGGTASLPDASNYDLASSNGVEAYNAAVTSYNDAHAGSPAGGQLMAMKTIPASSANGQVLVGQTYFKANLKKVIAAATAIFTVDEASGQLVGKASATIQTPVMNLAKSAFGFSHSEGSLVGTSAEARPSKVMEDTSSAAATSATPCIHVMDQSGSKTFWLDSNSGFNASGCEVRVRSNHFSSAMYEVASSNVKFAKIRVKGYASINSGYGTSKFYITQAPNKVLENEKDKFTTGTPYDSAVAAITKKIAAGACTAANTNKTLSGAVSPGTYCGTTEFKNATLGAGLYIIASGTGNATGGLKLSGSSDGSAGVTFYFADNKSKFVSYNLNENMVLKAPTSGTTKGILFFENSNRGSTYAMIVASCNKQSWTGVVYLPSVNLTLDSLSEWPTLNISLAVNQLKMKSLSSVMSPYAWTPDGYSTAITMEGDAPTTTRDGWLFK